MLRRQGVVGQPAVGVVRLRPAVHRQDQRHALVASALQRVEQDAFDLQPVAGRVAHHLLAGQADVGQPRVGIGQALRLRRVGGQPEHLAGVLGAVGQQGQVTAGGQAQRGPDRPTGRQQVALAAAVDADLPDPGLDALVADEDDALRVAPAHVPHVPLQAGQQVALFAAVAADHGQAALARVVDVLGADDGQVAAVGRPGQAAQLARVVHASEFAAGGVDDAHAGEHHRVVDQLPRRHHQGQAVAGRAPVHRLHRALDRQLARLGTVAGEVMDPQLHRTPVLLEHDLAEALLAQAPALRRLRLLRQQGDLAAVRRQAVAADVGAQLGDALGLAAVQRQAMQRALVVAVAAGEEGDRARIRHPAQGTRRGPAGDVEAVAALGVDHAQLGAVGSVLADPGFAGDRADVGDLAPVGADLRLHGGLGAGDLFQGHARGQGQRAQQHQAQHRQRALPTTHRQLSSFAW